jgi:peptide/nickel transport system ATP-binding protein
MIVETKPPVLSIENLTVAYRQGNKWLNAVQDVSFRIHAGEVFGLVGESGSGKTTLILALLRYLEANGAILNGSIHFIGQDLLHLSDNEMRHIWGKQIAFVPQNPQSSLNPTLQVGEQISEILRYQIGLTHALAHARAIELLEVVHLADPERVAGSYPHQISGGMLQRVMIAMALSTEPDLLVLDEPTTSLDVTTQAVILDLVRELIAGRQTAVLYITHNLGTVAQICDRVGVLYAGELVEVADTRDLYRQPLHPYTRGLLDSVPRLGDSKSRVQLRGIHGQIPALDDRPSGCVFSSRCPLVIDICQERPPLYPSGGNRSTRCHRWEAIRQGELNPRQPDLPVGRVGAVEAALQVVIKLEEVKVHFPVRRSPVDFLRGLPPMKVKAVDGVNVSIPRGRTLGLVGESGSGKTTVARTLLGLVERTSGSIELLGSSLPVNLQDRDLATLRHLQMVFQNPEEALNPNLTVGESLRRPLVTLLRMTKKDVEQAVIRLLDSVRLPPNYVHRFPNQLSGGEKQRIAIARAFASNPELVVCDEPVSSLDVSVQASILNLVNELQIQNGTSLFFISHDLAVVGYLADLMAVIYLGHIVEIAIASELFEPPFHPYTEALLSAIPVADPEVKRKDIRLHGEIPSPINIPSGCPFHTRCPRFLGEICVNEDPPWQSLPDNAKRYACHIPADQLVALQEQSFAER